RTVAASPTVTVMDLAPASARSCASRVIVFVCVTIAIPLPLGVRVAHTAVFDHLLVELLRVEDDLGCLFKRVGPLERLVKRLPGGKAAMPAQEHTFVGAQR